LESLPLLFGGTSSGFGSTRGYGWKECEEFIQGFIDPEQTESRFFEGFTATSE
jgi:hypothetical protein